MSAFYFFALTLILFCVFALAEEDPGDRNDGRRQQPTAAEADEQKQDTHQSLTS